MSPNTEFTQEIDTQKRVSLHFFLQNIFHIKALITHTI